MALAATAMMTSCSKEGPDGNKNDGTASLYMKVEQINSRAVSDAGTTGTPLTSLFVILQNGAGTAVGSEVDAKAVIGTPSQSVVGTLASQIIVSGIDLSVEKILAYGFKASTKPLGFALADYNGTKNINALQDVAFNDIPFFHTNSGAPTTDVISKTNTTPPAGKTGQVWTAISSLSPYFARFEIGGTPTAGTGVKTVTVTQIYLNNFAATYGATSTAHPGNLAYFTYDGSGNVTGTAGGNSGTTGDFGTAYYTAASTTMYGDPATAPQVQAFNLYAQSSMPHVVLKVTIRPSADVSDDGSLDYTGFITITGFKSTGSGTPAVTSIEAGNIYQLALGGLAINAADVDPEPEHEGADLYMTITVTDWTLVPITPN